MSLNYLLGIKCRTRQNRFRLFIFSTRLRSNIWCYSEGIWGPLMQCPLLVKAGIGNLAMVPAIAHLLFVKDFNGIFNIHRLMPADGTPSLMSICVMAHTMMNHLACETSGWQFVAGSGFKPRLNSLEASVHTSRSSCQPYRPDENVIRFSYSTVDKNVVQIIIVSPRMSGDTLV